MEKDNQIKEMAKDLGIAFQLAGTTRFDAVAEVLVNAGYRKVSEIILELISEIDNSLHDMAMSITQQDILHTLPFVKWYTTR